MMMVNWSSCKHPIFQFFKKSVFVTLDPKPDEGIVGEILKVSVARKCITGPWQSNKAKTLHNVCLKENILRLSTCNTLKIKMMLDGCCHVAWNKLFLFPSPHRRETTVEISATVSRDIITSYYHILQPKKEIHIVTTWYRHLCSVPRTEAIACLEPHLCRLERIQRF